MQRFSYEKTGYARKVLVPTLVCLGCLLFALIDLLFWRKIAPMDVVIAFVSMYQLLGVVMFHAYPEWLAYDNTNLSWGDKIHTSEVAWSDITSFLVKEFPATKTAFVRLTTKTGVKKKFWLYTAYMQNGDVVYRELVRRELVIHADGLKAQSRR